MLGAAEMLGHLADLAPAERGVEQVRAAVTPARIRARAARAARGARRCGADQRAALGQDRAQTVEFLAGGHTAR